MVAVDGTVIENGKFSLILIDNLIMFSVLMTILTASWLFGNPASESACHNLRTAASTKIRIKDLTPFSLCAFPL